MPIRLFAAFFVFVFKMKKLCFSDFIYFFYYFLAKFNNLAVPLFLKSLFPQFWNNIPHPFYSCSSILWKIKCPSFAAAAPYFLSTPIHNKFRLSDCLSKHCRNWLEQTLTYPVRFCQALQSARQLSTQVKLFIPASRFILFHSSHPSFATSTVKLSRWHPHCIRHYRC